MVCTIDLEPMSRQRHQVSTSELRSRKRSRVEVESESEWGEDGEKLEEAGKGLGGDPGGLGGAKCSPPGRKPIFEGIMRALLEGNKWLSRDPVDSTLKE